MNNLKPTTKRCPDCRHVMSKHETFCGAVRCLNEKCGCALTENRMQFLKHRKHRAAMRKLERKTKP